MRKLAYVCGAFSAGIFLAQYFLPRAWLFPAALVALGIACASQLFPREICRRVVLICLGAAVAFAWQWCWLHQLEGIQALENQREVWICAVVTDYPEKTARGSKVTVRLQGVPLGKAVLYADETAMQACPGQIVETAVRMQDASRIRETDVTAFTSRGIFLLAYQQGELTLQPGTEDSFRWWPKRLCHAMQEKIRAMFSEDTAPVILALLTGERDELPVQTETDFSEAGMLHMLAVSGLHCGFLLAMVVFLLGTRRHWMVSVVTLPLLIVYVFLTGASPSVVRAGVMMGFLLLADVFHRDADGITSLLAALAVLLAINPFSAASVSLQLSFASMAGVILVSPRIYAALEGHFRGKVWRACLGSLCATLGVLIFTTPLSVCYFGGLVLIAPLSNLFCFWAVGIVFCTALLSVGFGFLWMPAAGILVALAQILTKYLLAVAHFCANIPYHAVYRSNPYLQLTLVFLYVLLAVLTLMRSKRIRTYLTAAGAAVLLLSTAVVMGTLRFQNDLDIFVMNVGQGQCILLRSGSATALVDCGSANTWIHAGEIAAKQLYSVGSRELDYLLLTHFDTDHTSGVEELLCRIPVKTILIPEDSANRAPEFRMASTDTQIRIIRAWEQLDFGTGSLTVYPPVGEDGENQRGLSVLATAGTYDLLVTGDMESATEEKLLSTYPMPDIEALVVGHHGSRLSTSQELLERLKPEIACISVGSNSYGHPAKETLQRLAAAGCTVYRTDLQGNIHLAVKRE